LGALQVAEEPKEDLHTVEKGREGGKFQSAIPRKKGCGEFTNMPTQKKKRGGPLLVDLIKNRE